MKKILSFLIALLLAAALLPAAAEEIVYTATVTKNMTIREKKSTSAKKLGSVEAGEFISVLDYGKEWTLIEKDGVKGYVLSKNVDDLAAAQGYNDEAVAQFLGTADKELTLRAEKSKSAQKMGSFDKGETVYILELGETWHRAVRQGVEGYVLSSAVSGLRPAHEGIELPEEFIPAPPFQEVYTATAVINLSIRKEKDSSSRLLGTVYQNEEVSVMETDGEWAHVRKDGAEGYVLAEHLRYYKRNDPYGPLLPGVVCYPYAARALEEVAIVGAETDEALCTVSTGSVMAVSAFEEDMSVTLPYDLSLIHI